jgi:adenosylhomocysteine nucleosidase
MHKNNLVVLVALEKEVSKKDLPPEIHLRYTGVGKINAAITATEVILEFHSDLEIVNIGTCGSSVHPHGTVLTCTQFKQMDMDATAAGLELGTTPFSNKAPIIEFGNLIATPVLCGSQDKFETEIPSTVDCIEMEAFAIATACKKYDIPFRAYKVVSDQGGNQSHDAWLKFLENDMPLVINEIRELI